MMILNLSLLVVLLGSTYAQIKYCDPVESNINPDDLPKLPDEFQTRIEMNFISQKRNSEVLIYYDRFDKKAEVSIKEQDNYYKQIYFFDKNELFTVRDDACDVQKLTEVSENSFFGLVQDSNELNMKPPNFFLHFNNGFSHRKLEKTTWRGIPVNHYQSCQTWDAVKANVLVDYYFKDPDYKLAVNYQQDQFKETPVAVTVVGYSDINQSAQTKREINHEYAYFEFRTLIENKNELYNLPKGIFCKGQTYKEPIPNLPKTYSYFAESISAIFNFASNSRVFYSSEFNTFRVDLPTGQVISPSIKDPVKIIHDYNSGVGYIINKDKGNCTFYPIGSSSFDLVDNSHEVNGYYSLKSPNMFFFLDDNYFYAGQRYERGLLCDVFISNRTDYKTAFNANYYIFELYILNAESAVDQSGSRLEPVVPVSLHITAIGANYSVIIQYYDFDSKLDRDRFDISQCFQGKDKINFGVRFSYPQGVDKDSFTQFYGRILELDFEEKIFKSFKQFSASPLRIIPPRFEAHNSGFIVYSGVTNYAEPINHFLNAKKVKIDLQKIKHGMTANSAESCAYICLSDSVYNVPLDYKCGSFDVCLQPQGGIMCSFYNYTLETDSSVLSDSGTECDHYSKITRGYDSAGVDSLFRMVEESVIRKELNLDVKDNNGNQILSFPSEEIFTVTNQQEQQNRPGQTSANADFNETALSQNSKVKLRRKSGVSIDECTRLCIQEPAFDCQILTYSRGLLECKWSSIPFPIDENNNDNTDLLIEKEGFEVFIKDPLYNYIKYPFQVTSLVDYTVFEVGTETQCAVNCNKETKFKCRSFNFCSSPDGKSYRCLLSPTNINNQERDPNIVFSSLCSHFSKKALNDFELIPQTQLEAKPQSKLTNTSAESCAEICSLEDNFFCRSFDYFPDTNTCLLYKENVKDKFTTDLKASVNPSSNHYSRLYYEVDGALLTIEPLKRKASGKYGAGVVFGIVLTVIIGGLLFGLMLAFVYLKLTHKTDMIPVMRFVNPNYENQEGK